MKTNINTTKAIYWGSTGLFALMMAGSAVAYLTAPDMVKAFAHLGFPAYFRIELAIAKLLGVIVLLAPVPKPLKEWAYSGFAITMVSAFVAHAAVDGAQAGTPPLVGLAILLLSYTFLHRLEKRTANTATLQEALA